jgi:hypothetical protein
MNRQDAKFAKVDVLTREPSVSWRSWRLGGKTYLKLVALSQPTVGFRPERQFTEL